MPKMMHLRGVLAAIVILATSVACGGGSRSTLPPTPETVGHRGVFGVAAAATATPGACATPTATPTPKSGSPSPSPTPTGATPKPSPTPTGCATATPTPKPSPSPSSLPIRYKIAANVNAAAGGSLTLPDGTEISFDPGALSADGLVTLIEYNGSENVPTTGYVNLGNSVDVTVTAVNPSYAYAAPSRRMLRPESTSAAPSLEITTNVGNAGAAANGFLLTVGLVYMLDGSPVNVGLLADADGANVTSLLGKAALLASTAQHWSFSVVQSLVAPGHAAVSPGLRFATVTSGAYSWTTTPPIPGADCVHPVLFLHGIFSDLEATFSSTTLAAYAENGGYDCILGYEYNWLQLPSAIGPQIASAVNAYFGKTIPNLDIVGHSYGGVNAIAAIPLLNVNEIQNFTAFNSPLNGSYLTDLQFIGTYAANAYEVASLPAASTSVFGTVPAFSYTAVVNKIAWENAFASGANDANIAAMLKSPHAPINVILVAGTQTIPIFGQLVNMVAIPHTAVNDGVVDRTSAQYDDVVGKASALEPGIPLPLGNVIPLTYGTNHVTTVPNSIVGDLASEELEYVVRGGDSVASPVCAYINQCFAFIKNSPGMNNQTITYYLAPIASPPVTYSATIAANCQVVCFGPLSASSILSLSSTPTVYGPKNSVSFATRLISTAAQAGSAGLLFSPPGQAGNLMASQYSSFEFEPECLQCVPAGTPTP